MEEFITVESIMTRTVLTVRVEDSFEAIRDVLENVEFHHLLVEQGGRLMGVLSDRDILKVLSAGLAELKAGTSDRPLLDTKVQLFMTPNPVTVGPDTSVDRAARVLLEQNISCLPVVSADGDVEGLVTWKDILRHHISRSVD